MSQKTHLDELDKMDAINVDTTKVDVLGWHDIKREDLPYEGALFPMSYQFKVKAASAGSIAHYSAMDESNPLSVQAALTEIIKKHIQVLDNGKVVDPLSVIYEEMRFWFVMLVHAYTGNTTSLENKENCKNSNCRKPQTVVITPFNMKFTELNEFTKKYLEEVTGKILVETKSHGVIEYQPVTLAMRAELLSFMQERLQSGEEFDLQFLKYAPVIFPLRLEKQTIASLYSNIYFPMTQNVKKFSVFTKIVNEISIKQNLDVLHTCTVCDTEYRLDISKTGGLSSIFLDKDTDNEFL